MPRIIKIAVRSECREYDCTTKVCKNVLMNWLREKMSVFVEGIFNWNFHRRNTKSNSIGIRWREREPEKRTGNRLHGSLIEIIML